MVFSLDETCRVSSCVVLRRVAALNFIFPALTTPLSAQAFLGYDVLETTASSYLKVPNHAQVSLQSHVCIDQSTVRMKAGVLHCFGDDWNIEAKMEGKRRYVLANPSIREGAVP